MGRKTFWALATQIAIASILTVLSLKTHADDLAMTPQFTKCMNDVDLGALKNNQWGACYEAELGRQNKKLELEYKKLKSTYKGSEKNLLDEAKKSWMTYREKWCRYEEALPIAPTPYVNYRACLVETTIDQINKIKRFLPNPRDPLKN